MYQIVLDEIIKPCPRPRARKAGGVYLPREYLDFKRRIALEIKASRPEIFVQGPVKVWIVFTYRAPRKSMWGTHRTIGADLDNLAKTVLDALTDAGVFSDDDQVAELVLSKLWGERASTRLAIERLPLRALEGTPA